MIYLIGPMASGKSTVGKSLAAALSLPFIDTDELIVAAHGSIASIFAAHGEQRFRDLEEETLAGVSEGVIATGGGAVLREANRQVLARGTVVYLEMTAAGAAARIKGDSTRPLLAGDEALSAWTTLLAARKGIYESIADVRVLVDDKPVLQIVEEITARLGHL
ncbi:shikimate kinase [Glutamicibacter protophormiae]|uniref:Shikimate kinase n=1 Tax=Glutamicibacter protophormiae TaxID=37930 RepID=A0ABS4XVG0_GLUPR|nr:shikimate kinase [Glutamicibacter protophormiae]MBP2399703.1 shikimate kinase [Glutamicibacter protophormiae]GGL88507.1 shikimate kinase [Glutamicibacter protophormiae]